MSFRQACKISMRRFSSMVGFPTRFDQRNILQDAAQPAQVFHASLTTNSLSLNLGSEDCCAVPHLTRRALPVPNLTHPPFFGKGLVRIQFGTSLPTRALPERPVEISADPAIPW